MVLTLRFTTLKQYADRFSFAIKLDYSLCQIQSMTEASSKDRILIGVLIHILRLERKSSRAKTDL